MPNFGSLEDLWRRSLDLNLRYYGALGQLAADYLKDLATTMSQVATAQTASTSPSTTAGPPPPRAGAPTVTASAVTTAPAPPTGAMVLEGEAGSKALGVFLVENHLSREVTARVVASAFVDANGREVRPKILFDPETITLGSGEQLLVRVVASIDESLEPEVRYMGQFTIPELVGTRIPVVLRRQLTQEQEEETTTVAQTEASAPAASAVAKSKKRAGRSRSAKAKRSSGAGTG